MYHAPEHQILIPYRCSHTENESYTEHQNFDAVPLQLNRGLLPDIYCTMCAVRAATLIKTLIVSRCGNSWIVLYWCCSSVAPTERYNIEAVHVGQPLNSTMLMLFKCGYVVLNSTMRMMFSCGYYYANAVQLRLPKSLCRFSSDVPLNSTLLMLFKCGNQRIVIAYSLQVWMPLNSAMLMCCYHWLVLSRCGYHRLFRRCHHWILLCWYWTVLCWCCSGVTTT